METLEAHEHDVLVIGAGGAGLRAAIEASAQGARVGLVCKSLLGKAHTVMAEGGVAAALGHDRVGLAEQRLADQPDLHARRRRLDRGAQTGAAGANDKDVVGQRFESAHSRR